MTVSEPEPEFDDLDRGWFEALFDLRADEHSCGGVLSETTDNTIVWTAEPDGYCNRCYALAFKQHLHANAKNPEIATDAERADAEKHAKHASQLWASEPRSAVSPLLPPD